MLVSAVLEPVDSRFEYADGEDRLCCSGTSSSFLRAGSLYFDTDLVVFLPCCIEAFMALASTSDSRSKLSRRRSCIFPKLGNGKMLATGGVGSFTDLHFVLSNLCVLGDCDAGG